MGVLQEIKNCWNLAEDRILRKNIERVDWSKVGVVGYFLMIAGVWAGNCPAIAIPSISVGFSSIVEATHLMNRQKGLNGNTE